MQDTNQNGDDVVHRLSRSKDVAGLQAFLEENRNNPELKRLLNSANATGETPLSIAAYNNDQASFRVLHSAAANPLIDHTTTFFSYNSLDTVSFQDVLTPAIINNNATIIESLWHGVTDPLLKSYVQKMLSEKSVNVCLPMTEVCARLDLSTIPALSAVPRWPQLSLLAYILIKFYLASRAACRSENKIEESLYWYSIIKTLLYAKDEVNFFQGRNAEACLLFTYDGANASYGYRPPVTYHKRDEFLRSLRYEKSGVHIYQFPLVVWLALITYQDLSQHFRSSIPAIINDLFRDILLRLLCRHKEPLVKIDSVDDYSEYSAICLENVLVFEEVTLLRLIKAAQALKSAAAALQAGTKTRLGFFTASTFYDYQNALKQCQQLSPQLFNEYIELNIFSIAQQLSLRQASEGNHRLEFYKWLVRYLVTLEDISAYTMLILAELIKRHVVPYDSEKLHSLYHRAFTMFKEQTGELFQCWAMHAFELVQPSALKAQGHTA